MKEILEKNVKDAAARLIQLQQQLESAMNHIDQINAIDTPGYAKMLKFGYNNRDDLAHTKAVLEIKRTTVKVNELSSHINSSNP